MLGQIGSEMRSPQRVAVKDIVQRLGWIGGLKGLPEATAVPRRSLDTSSERILAAVVKDERNLALGVEHAEAGEHPSGKVQLSIMVGRVLVCARPQQAVLEDWPELGVRLGDPMDGGKREHPGRSFAALAALGRAASRGMAIQVVQQRSELVLVGRVVHQTRLRKSRRHEKGELRNARRAARS
jgi:hypothetical protein